MVIVLSAQSTQGNFRIDTVNLNLVQKVKSSTLMVLVKNARHLQSHPEIKRLVLLTLANQTK